VSHNEKPVLGLANAALVAYLKATDRRSADEGTLNYVARMIATRTRVLTCSDSNFRDPRPLTADEAFQGQFEGGGTQVSFADGRRSLTNLCVRFEDLPGVTDAITSLFKSGAFPGEKPSG
jgi:hypothetical protein